MTMQKQNCKALNIPCKCDYCIAVTKGFWTWWCTSHHQPFWRCKDKKAELLLIENCLVKLKELEEQNGN